MVNLLIVDYNRLQCRCIERICERIEQVVLHIAHTYEDALVMCRDRQIHQIIINVDMPQRLGIDLLRYVHYAYPAMKTAIMTSHHSVEVACMAMKYKVSSCLHTPIMWDEFKQCIHLEETSVVEKSMAEPIQPIVEAVHQSIRQGQFLQTYGHMLLVWKGLPKGTLEETCERLYQMIRPFLGDSSCESSKDLMKSIPLTYTMLGDQQAQEIGIFKLVDWMYRTYNEWQQPLLHTVLSYIDEHIHEDISLKHIVANCNVSQGYASRLFKMKFHMTVMQYIHYKKMNMAKEYLSMTELSGSDISHKLGYSDVSYFCKIFKKYVKHTISQYRDRVSLTM